MLNPNPTPRCSQCGSELILVSSVTEKIEGHRFSQTITTYRCSNQACQEEKDRQTAKRLQKLQEKEESDRKRASLRFTKKAKPAKVG